MLFLTLLFGALAAPSLVSAAFLDGGGSPTVPFSVEKAPIQYMTDSEGFMQHFCQWVLDNPAIEFAQDFEKNVDYCVLAGKDAHQLEFKDDETVFVFGGDATTRGDGSKRILRALVDFKARYPERVFLIVGNRDAMMMRLTSEWADPEVHSAWVHEAKTKDVDAFATNPEQFNEDARQFLTYQFAPNSAFGKAAPVAAPWSSKIAESETLRKLAHLHWLQANSQGSPASVRWAKKEQCVLHYAERRNKAWFRWSWRARPTPEEINLVKDNCFSQCAGPDADVPGAKAETMAGFLDEPEPAKPGFLASWLVEDKSKCGGATWKDVLNDFEKLVKLPTAEELNNLFFEMKNQDVHERLAFLKNTYRKSIGEKREHVGMAHFHELFGDLAWYMMFANVGLRFGPRFIVHGDITGTNGLNPEPIDAGPKGAFSCIPGEANGDVFIDKRWGERAEWQLDHRNKVKVIGRELDLGEDEDEYVRTFYPTATDIRQCVNEPNEVDSVDKWVANIQFWLERQVFAWMVQPTFVSAFPRIGVEGAVATANRKTAKDPHKYKMMLAARQVRDRGGAALIEYAAIPSAESSEVPTVIYTRAKEHYSDEIHTKLENGKITTIIIGHTPNGFEPGAKYSMSGGHQILVINGDTSYSNASPKTAYQGPGYLPEDARGVAVSWIKLWGDGQVDVTSRVAMTGYNTANKKAFSPIETLRWDLLPTTWSSVDPARPGSTITVEEEGDVSEEFRNALIVKDTEGTETRSFTTLAKEEKIRWLGPLKTTTTDIRVRTAQAVDGYSLYYDLVMA